MTMLRYNIQTGANGSIMIPTTPFAVGEEVEVLLLEKYRDSQPLDEDWQPPTDTKQERKRAFEELCDAWCADERSTEEIICDIYESRTIGREREPL